MPMTSDIRRTISHDSRNKGGGSFGSWREEMRLTKDMPTSFMLIAKMYLDPAPAEDELIMDKATGMAKPVMKFYAKGVEHRRKQSADVFYNSECSAGWDRHNPKTCVGCHYVDTGDKSFGTSEKFRIGIVHLVPYHGHPVWNDEERKFLTKKESNELVINFDPCENTPSRQNICNYCRHMQGQPPINNNPKKIFPAYPQGSVTVKFGNRRYLNLGKSHLECLIGWDQTVSMKCTTMTEHGPCNVALTTMSFNCPDCKNVIIDMRTDTRTDDQIKSAVNQAYPCMTCQKGVLLQEIVSCEPCTAAGRKHTQQMLFGGVILKGMRQGENMKSKLVLAEHLSQDEFARDPYIKNWLEWSKKTLQQVIEELSAPYDFDVVCKPLDLEGQAKRYHVDLPAALANATNYTPPPGGVATAPQGPPPIVAYGQSMPMPSPAFPQPNGQAPGPMMPAPRPDFGKQ